MEEDFFVDDVSGDDSETGESTDGDYGEYHSSDGEDVYEVNEGLDEPATTTQTISPFP
jgi:hypothetical protein